MINELTIKVQKDVDRHYKLYKDVESGKQLKEDIAKLCIKLLGLDPAKWYPIETREYFNNEIAFLREKEISELYIADVIGFEGIEKLTFRYPEYVKVIELIHGSAYGQFFRCIIVNKAYKEYGSLSEAISRDFDICSKMEDTLIPSEMEE